MKNIYKFKVHFGDTDAAGIVFYPNFYRWMDQATHEYFSDRYMSTAQLQKEENIIIPLLETFCQFKTPLFFEDQVEVHSCVTEVKRKVFKIEHEFKRDNLLIAKGYEVRAWTHSDGEKIKAIEIPDNISTLFGITKVNN